MKNLLIDNFDPAYGGLRAYEKKDREQIVKVIDLVCAECEWMSTKIFIPTLQWLHAFSEPECNYHLLLVAERNGKLFGWCRLFPEQCSGNRKIGELGIGLLADCRNQKIGSTLLDLALKWAHNSGMYCVNLSVNRNNLIALRLFEKFYFKYTSSSDVDCFLMSSKV